MSYAEIAVNSPLKQARTFSYSIPEGMQVCVGQAVRVPFGKQVLQGIVMELTRVPAVEQTRDIIETLGDQPLLRPYQVELARWMSQYYLASPFECAALMLPPGFQQKPVTTIKLSPDYRQDGVELTAEQNRLVGMLSSESGISLNTLAPKFGKKNIERLVNELLKKDIIIKIQQIKGEKVRFKKVPYAQLAVDAGQVKEIIRGLSGRYSKQVEVLQLLLAKSGSADISEIKEQTGCGLSTIRSLEKKGAIKVDYRQVDRDPLSHLRFDEVMPPVLTEDQEGVLKAICGDLEGANTGKQSVFLLCGVTGSGKTEIYLRTLSEAVSRGKKGIVLVPEIALTPQTISRFASRFPGRVAVIHSRLSPGEQYDEWHRISRGQFDVVIGSRSALFAPQPDLGLVIIDEEHEWAYKQHEQAPRYHCRRVAEKLAGLTGSLLVLGSATPDVESYYNTTTSKYRLLELPRRITPRGDPTLPSVDVVDIKEELMAGNRHIFSRKLIRAMEETLSRKEQIILFLNRRGSATIVQCRNCGFALKCKRCDASLTYHDEIKIMVCHQCGYKMTPPLACPRCTSRQIKYLGAGTQKVEEVALATFPGARVLRWDRDTASRKHAHEEIANLFLSHQADILIGTQMIAKGLDMPMVTLVGVISADTGLFLPDFRSAERTFQLLSQVAGRAGRGMYGGYVIIQTYNPQNYAIKAVARNDYRAFYEKEIEYRAQQGNPPFNRIARLLYSHANAGACQRESERIYNLLREVVYSRREPEMVLVGPAPAFVQRIRGRFRWQIIIRHPDPALIISQITLPNGWTIDIDPVTVI